MGWIKMSTKIKENWFFLNNFFLLGGGLWRNLLLSEIFSEFSFEIPKYECLTNMIDLTETSCHAFIQNSRRYTYSSYHVFKSYFYSNNFNKFC